jgi:hypothetical protein
MSRFGLLISGSKVRVLDGPPTPKRDSERLTRGARYPADAPPAKINQFENVSLIVGPVDLLLMAATLFEEVHAWQRTSSSTTR